MHSRAMPDSVRVRYPLSLIVFPKPESNSFPKLRLVDFYSHHATPPPRSSPVREYTPPILVRQENKHSRIHTATRSHTDLHHSLQGREGGIKIEAVAPGRCECLAQRWVHSASRCRLMSALSLVLRGPLRLSSIQALDGVGTLSAYTWHRTE